MTRTGMARTSPFIVGHKTRCQEGIGPSDAEVINRFFFFTELAPKDRCGPHIAVVPEKNLLTWPEASGRGKPSVRLPHWMVCRGSQAALVRFYRKHERACIEDLLNPCLYSPALGIQRKYRLSGRELLNRSMALRGIDRSPCRKASPSLVVDNDPIRYESIGRLDLEVEDQLIARRV